MRIPRVFVDEALSCGSVFALPDPAARHVHRALRLAIGAPLVLFNGLGGAYEAHIEAIDARIVRVRVGALCRDDREPTLELGLAQAISKGAKMDYTIQKAVELGVSWIQPLFAERSVVRLDRERAPARLARWREVARSACEQCGRNRVPMIRPVVELPRWMSEGQDDSNAGVTRLVLDPAAATSVSRIAEVQSSVWMLVGPEGGLTPGEISGAEQAGFQPVRLGPRILRTETAAVAAVTIAQWLWGDLND